MASKKVELNKLGKDLDLTEQACRTLQQSFKEYCPDIRRQETQVKHLKNRYSNINNQLQERLGGLKVPFRLDYAVTVTDDLTFIFPYFSLDPLSFRKLTIKTKISRMLIIH